MKQAEQKLKSRKGPGPGGKGPGGGGSAFAALFRENDVLETVNSVNISLYKNLTVSESLAYSGWDTVRDRSRARAHVVENLFRS